MNMCVEQVRADVSVAIPEVECLDVNNAKAFRQAILPVLQEGKNVVIDLSKVEFMDSSGLGAILSCLRRAGQTGSALKLSGMSEEIRALFAALSP